MRIRKHLVKNPLVFVLAGCLVVVGLHAALADSYSVTGPDGNTVTVTDSSISGSFYGATGTATDDSVTVSDGSSGGGGGSSNEGAVIVAVVVLAVAAGIFYWWYKNRPTETAKTDSLMEYKFNDSTRIALSTGMLDMSDEFDMEQDEIVFEEVCDARLAVGIRF